MRVVVQDASVLIDLGAAEMFDAWFSLKIETLTTSLVWREINRRTQKAKLRQFSRDNRIRVMPLGTEAMSEVVQLKLDLPRNLTLKDVSVLHLAMREEAVLLTGDQTLRSCAEARGVQTHGVLWLLDYMVEKRVLPSQVAVKKLELLCRLNPRLPRAECDNLLSKWRAS